MTVEARTKRLQTTDEIRECIITIIVEECEIDRADVTDQSHLLNDLGLTRLDIITLAREIEDKYAIDLAELNRTGLKRQGNTVVEDWPVSTLAALIELVQAKLSGVQ